MAQWVASAELMPEAVLAEVNRLWIIGRTYSSTAHAVNNALQVIGGRAELLVARTSPPPDFIDRVEVIRAQSQRAGTAIDTLLSYARAGTDPQLTALEDLVQVTVAMRAHSLHRAGIALDVQLQPAGGPLFLPRSVFQQLLLNLLLLIESRLVGRLGGRVAVVMTCADQTARLAICTHADSGEPRTRYPGEDFGVEPSFRVTRFLAQRLGYDVQTAGWNDEMPSFVLVIPLANRATAP